MNQETFALIDINNCYVSCERVFKPALNGTPVVVLSNNDGCIVSRSNEAKALKIGMAAPWHEVRENALRAGVQVFSSNYPLYADMSRRFFMILQAHFSLEDLEPYSIDECFIRLSSYQNLVQSEQYCRDLVDTIQQWLGLPCCIGIGSSKTQAKLANHFAKTYPGFRSVCNLPAMDLCNLESLMMQTPVSEVWGIGSKISKRLAGFNIHSSYDLTFANEHHLSKQFSVLLGRTIRELKGQSCIALEDPNIPSKQILSSRSFSQALSDKDTIKQALIFHVNRAHQRLTAQHQLCAVIHVSLYEKISQPPYKKIVSYALGLEYASDDLLEINQAALRQIDVLFKENIKYVKISVLLSALELKSQHTYDLWQPIDKIQQRGQLMNTLQAMKRKYGADCIQAGYASRQTVWKMKQEHRSPRYTTCWNELLSVG